MNVRFVLRGLAVALPAALVMVAVGIGRVYWQAYPPPGPMPAAPTIHASPGSVPDGPVGLGLWVRYSGEVESRAGAGFLLRMDGGWVGVSAAHNLSFDDPTRPIEVISLRVPGDVDNVVSFTALHGSPGRPRTGDDLTVDYLLLHSPQDAALDPALLLAPDLRRGGPQAGERVTLIGGVTRSERWHGSVYSAEAHAAWVVMDEWFNPAGMSGAPVVSQTTGQVVGMAIAAQPMGTRLAIGLHPIGALVERIAADGIYDLVVKR